MGMFVYDLWTLAFQPFWLYLLVCVVCLLCCGCLYERVWARLCARVFDCISIYLTHVHECCLQHPGHDLTRGVSVKSEWIISISRLSGSGTREEHIHPLPKDTSERNKKECKNTIPAKSLSYQPHVHWCFNVLLSLGCHHKETDKA